MKTHTSLFFLKKDKNNKNLNYMFYFKMKIKEKDDKNKRLCFYIFFFLKIRENNKINKIQLKLNNCFFFHFLINIYFLFNY